MLSSDESFYLHLTSSLLGAGGVEAAVNENVRKRSKKDKIAHNFYENLFIIHVYNS